MESEVRYLVYFSLFGNKNYTFHYLPFKFFKISFHIIFSSKLKVFQVVSFTTLHHHNLNAYFFSLLSNDP